MSVSECVGRLCFRVCKPRDSSFEMFSSVTTRAVLYAASTHNGASVHLSRAREPFRSHGTAAAAALSAALTSIVVAAWQIGSRSPASVSEILLVVASHGRPHQTCSHG